MKVLVLTQYFWPENFRINELVLELEKRGHEVTILTGFPNYPTGFIDSDFLRKPAKYDSFHGIDVIRVPLIPRGSSKLQLVLNYLSFTVSAATLGALRTFKKKYDLIFVFEPSPILIGLAAIVFKRIHKIPIVFWVLDLWPETLKALGIVKNEVLYRGIGRVVSFIYKHCDLILGQSLAFLPQIKKWSGKSDVRYFPNWVESTFDSPEFEMEGTKERNILKPFEIVFAGNIGEAQDFPTILKALANLPSEFDLRLTVIGDGRYYENLSKTVFNLNLEEKVHLLGRYPLEDMPAFFARADALLVTLKRDPISEFTIPGKLQSYLGAGKPILAMLAGEGARLVKENDCGLCCEPENAAALGDIISQIYRMTPENRDKLGANAKKLAKNSFDRNFLIDQLDDWLKETAVG